MSELRSSQRVPLRCTECARRRLKCDKEVPCKRCITGHRAHMCMREVVKVRGRPTVAIPSLNNANASLAQQNSRLHERLCELEIALVMSVQGRAGLRSGSVNATAHNLARQIIPHDEVGAVLDDWNIGSLNHEESWSSNPGESMHAFIETLRTIPERATSRRIVEFSLRVFGWIHCALRVDEFFAQHEAFQDSLETGAPRALQDYGWMAKYFSVLTVGMFFMSDEETLFLNLPEAFREETPLTVCRLWYMQACRQLELSDAMGKPQLHVVQVAAILTLCHSHLGHSYREVNLSSLALNTARALKMDRLATEASYPKSLDKMQEWANEAERERGRRLWWTLVICDWMMASRRPPSIHPDTFDCSLSPGRYDYNIIFQHSPELDRTIPCSPLMHHLKLSEIARLLYDYNQAPKKSLEMLFKLLDQLDASERNFLDEMDRQSIEHGAAIPKDAPPRWLIGQRAHFLCTVNFMRLHICRILLEPSLSHLPACSQIRDHGIKAALAVVHLENVPAEYQLLWVFGSTTIAAGVFLCLDLLTTRVSKTAEQVQDQRVSIELCIASLQRHSHKTTICREGPKILRRLLDFEMSKRGHHVSEHDVVQFIMSQRDEARHKIPENDPQELDSLPSLNQDLAFQSGDPSLASASSDVSVALGMYDYSQPSWFMDNFLVTEPHNWI